MARVLPLWQSAELSLHRFDHPVEHEDQPYEEIADRFQASFVEDGRFTLEVGERRWRVGAGDLMLSHPDMRFRAGFEGAGFNDTCLTLTYLAAGDDGFDGGAGWASDRIVRPASNHLLYLRWGLARALALKSPMFIEYCAAAIFRPGGETGKGALFRERKLGWYAERIDFARERIARSFAEAITVSALARDAGMSLFHFSRVFTALVGVPPHRYLLGARLDAARRMLAEGATVTHACYDCGFANLSHFSRSFRRRFGRAPSAGKIAG